MKKSLSEITLLKMPNKQMHSDSKKRRSFLALLFAAGDLRRWADFMIEEGDLIGHLPFVIK